MSESTQLAELPLPERAVLAIGYSKNKAALAALAKQSSNIVEIKDEDGFKEAQAARMMLRGTRVEIEKLGKGAREDAISFSKAVITAQDELIGVIEPEEKRLQTVQDVWTAARDAEKKAAQEAEMKAREELNRRVEAIQSGLKFGDTSDGISARIDQIKAVTVDESYGAMQTIALQRKANALEELMIAHGQALQAEQAKVETEKLRAQQDEMQRQQRELQAAQARLLADQQAAEEAKNQLERERIRREAAELAAKVEAEQAAINAQRRANEQEQARIQAERAAAEAKAQAEADAAAAKVKAEAEAKAQAEADAAKRPDKEKLLAFAEEVGKLTVPEMATDEGAELAHGITNSIVSLQSRIKAAAENL
jgi:hypothetical protein